MWLTTLYYVVILFICILFNLQFINHNYLDSWVAKDKDITLHTRVTQRMNKKVIIDTTSKDIQEETQWFRL